MKFGERIKLRRQRLGFTQSEIASKLYITRQTISSWENSNSYPDLNMLVNISNIYQISIDSLLKEDQRLKEYLTKKEVKKHYGPVSNLSVWLVSILVMAFAIMQVPAAFPPIVGNVLEDAGIAVVALWFIYDSRFSSLFNKSEPQNWFDKAINAEVLSAVMLFLAGVSIVVDVWQYFDDNLVIKTFKNYLSFSGSASISNARILFACGVILLVSGITKDLVQRYADKKTN